jgi:hypothetical protein
LEDREKYVTLTDLGDMALKKTEAKTSLGQFSIMGFGTSQLNVRNLEVAA